MAADGAEEDYDGQGHKPFMMRHAQVRSRASSRDCSTVHRGRAAVRLYNWLKSNKSTTRKILRADMQL